MGVAGMHITRVDIENLPPLGILGFNCDERVNLFIGPNASGKSAILRAISSLNSPLAADGGEHDFIVIGDGAPLFFLFASDDWPRDVHSHVKPDATPPVLYIPAVRVGLRGRDIFGRMIDEEANLESENPLADLFDTDSGVFYGQYVESAIDWLREKIIRRERLQLEYGADAAKLFPEEMAFNRGKQAQLRRALDTGYSCARRICAEVMRDAISHPFVEVDEYEESGKTVHYGMGIGTSDDVSGEALYAGVLSSGTQGSLLWIYALALKMANHYDWQEEWESKPAILLIDEIENHLHPTWQRRVIPALLEHFPRLQIFAATHSPFVVAGLKEGQVHLLNRDPETGAVTASTNAENVVGWTADEILRTMLGVDDPTDERTANAAQELRQLRKEWPRDTAEEEERRQERMRELRKLVDRDLLAGGPWKRQREIFEQHFAESLRKYRESQNLNQENG